MTVEMRRLAALLCLAGSLAVGPDLALHGMLGSSDALASNAGGNGKGQGAAKSGGIGGGGGGAASAKGTSPSKEKKTYEASAAGRFNGPLNASRQAWANASPQSPMGILTAYANDLESLLGSAVDPETASAETPTIEQLGAVLATVANKQTISPEVIAALHAKMVEVGVLDGALLEQGSALLSPASADAAAPAPTLAERLAEQANLAQSILSNEGLGPIY